MRIRKRFLSLSAAITAPPPSDPHGGDHKHKHQQPLLLVQQQVHPNGNLRVLYDNTRSRPFDPPLNHCSSHLPPTSSDLSTQIGLQTATWVSTGAGSEAKYLVVSPHKELESEKKETIETDDTGSLPVSRKESTVCAEASSRVNTASLPRPPTTAHLVLKGWLDGDRPIPLKKRRGSFGKGTNHHLDEDNEMINITMTPKPKKYDRCVRVVSKEVNAMCAKNKKNGKRGNVIMEGSRCSRVNGRGWRCCQQTLVGYSLCEHHLGKGRLRSMNSVRGRAQKVSLKEQDKEVETISMDHPDFEDDDKDWEDDSVSSMEGKKKINKKKKLGVVKARSLSSLLSQIGS